MRQVKLIARTHYSRELLKKHGEIWDVIMTNEDMIKVRSQGLTFKPYIFDPQTTSEYTHAVRWLDTSNDTGFFIEPYTGGA